MPSFRNAKKQAEHAIKQKLSIKTARHTHRDDKKIHSLGAARNYVQALNRLTQWLQKNKLGDLKSLNKMTAQNYLEFRGQSVGQKLLDQERQAIQLHLGFNLPVIKSELTQVLHSRAYTEAQIKMLSKAQSTKNRLATELAFAAGLRAHELLTLRPAQEQMKSNHRSWCKQRFVGRAGKIYTVIGKGGLVREVLIPLQLADTLEDRRLASPIIIQDRNIHYKQYYNVAGGKTWSSSFSKASHRLFNWSHGAHGLRHSYAQARMNELQQHGLTYDHALGIVSQELGHFRADITKVYLR